MHARRLFLLLIAILVFSPAVLAQPSDLSAKVDAIFAQYNKPTSPGCALGVIKNGQLIYARGYGMANLEHNIPITPKTVFDIGSTSKQFTAASILLLAQQGKLTLEDDIRKFIPEMPAYNKPITINHLLHHTSGIRDYLGLMSLAGINFEGVTTSDDALRIITRQKALNFTPGDEQLYSNSGYFLLSVIVQRASGKTLREFAQENIFNPLGMKNTHFHDDHTMIVPMRATGYFPSKDGFRIAMSGFEQTGDGAVMTTIEDLLLWDQNFYQPKVGGKELINQLHVKGTLNSGEKLGYARGLAVGQYKGLNLVSHSGSWAGYRADLIRFPDQQFSVACLCNVGNADPSSLARQVAEVYLADQFVAKTEAQPSKPAESAASKPAAVAPAAVTLKEEELKPRAGLYRNTRTGAFNRIVMRDGKLAINAFGTTLNLVPVSPTEFRADAPMGAVRIAFEPARAGAPQQFRLTVGNGAPQVFEAVESFDPTPAQLAEYAGTYYSEELGVSYTLLVEGGKLMIEGANVPRRPLEPTTRDRFNAGNRQFEFSRDAQGRVQAFDVQAGRIRNVRFVREARR